MKRHSRISYDNAKKSKRNDVNVDFNYDSGLEDSDDKNSTVSESGDEETAEVQRVRMAKEILNKLKVDETESDNEQSDPTKLDKVSQKLHDNLLEAEGRLQKPVADSISILDKTSITRGHRLSATSVAISTAEDFCFTASKDCSIVRWDIETGRRLKKYPGHPATKNIPKKSVTGHSDEVLSLSLSTDGRYLASGGRDKLIYIWDVRTDSIVDSFSGHQDAVSGVVFQQNKHLLYSCSHDRSVRAWNIDEMAYVESLFGHTSNINGIDALYFERAVTCSTDRSVRYWKIPEESQLLLQGYHSGSIDCVRMINETHFLTGSQDGHLAMWATNKKKPCSLIKQAHGGSWITAVASLKNSDLVASGSSDGYIRFCKVDFASRQLSVLEETFIPVTGYVNGLAFGPSGTILVGAIGQEHRLGRWDRISKAKNGLLISRLSPSNSDDDSNIEDEESD